MFCVSSRFRFGVRVIYSTAVFIKSVFSTCFKLQKTNILRCDGFSALNQPSNRTDLKCHYDENHIVSIEAILKHKQVACMRRKMLFTIFKYLFLFQRYSSF